jgi:serine/threonine protein kinase
VRVCAACGRELPAAALFCDGCGESLAAETPSRTSVSLEPSVPSSFASGRYRVERLLGEGAKKRVYLARDTRLDREVAIGVIKQEGLDAEGRARVQREARAMGRLGDHPHVVTVHDVVEEDGDLYLVSQYVPGGDLETRLAQAEEHRLGIEDVLRLGAELCRALEHAHSRGVIHRDVKPGNVYLGEEDQALLGDFGLAVSLDRTRLTREGMMVGTAAYMAPEQALGKPPDERSDLYGLGGLLYETLAGRPPFVGDDAVAVISQHLNTSPVAPKWHSPDIPRPLEALVLRLLEKDPEARPASAAQVRELLQAIESAPSEAAAEPVEANPLDRLASGVFVGREPELTQARDCLDAALSGRGQLLLLVGEPGIGKTRTAEELTTWARMRGAQVLWGRCYEGEGAPAYWPWVQIIRAYVHDHTPEELRAEMGAAA